MAHSRRHGRRLQASASDWRRSAARCWRWPPACPAWRRLQGSVAQAGAAGLIAKLQPRPGAAGGPVGRRVPGAQPLRPGQHGRGDPGADGSGTLCGRGCQGRRGRAAPASPGWLASHPSNDQRLQQIRVSSKRLAASQPAGWADEGRDRYLRAVDGLGFGGGVSRVWCAVAGLPMSPWASPSPHRQAFHSATRTNRYLWSQARAIRHW